MARLQLDVNKTLNVDGQFVTVKEGWRAVFGIPTIRVPTRAITTVVQPGQGQIGLVGQGVNLGAFSVPEQNVAHAHKWLIDELKKHQ
jgi:hypothetical protein